MNPYELFKRLVENERYFDGYRDFEECLEGWLRLLRTEPGGLPELAATAMSWGDAAHRQRAGYLLDFAAALLGAALPEARTSPPSAVVPAALFWKNSAARATHDDLAQRWGLAAGVDFGRLSAALAHP